MRWEFVRMPRCAVIAMTAVAMAVLGAEAEAAVKDVNLKDLAVRSDLIVVAKVTKIELGPVDLGKLDASFPRLNVATAQVVETWKGEPAREVRYVASPGWVCDITRRRDG